MEIKQAFTLAVKSLMSSKMRSFLTMLGIIIGVAAVIILVSLVNGFSNSMVSSFESMGTNLINVTIIGRGSSRSVSADEMMEFAEENYDLISYLSPSVTASITAKYLDTNVSTTAQGCNEYFADIKGLSMSSGRFLAYTDVEKRCKVCVIGSYIANELYAGQNPIGMDLKINGDNYKIVGVASEKADSSEGTDDDKVYIPYTRAVKINRSGIISSYVLSAADGDRADDTVAVIKNFLYQKFNSDDYYNVSSMSDALDSVNELVDTLTLVLVGIAGISLLVGGIGIMNIMLVSVTERTREIGIRKSLGARPWDILSQFVVEAATTSSLGGVIGILLGVFTSYAVGGLVGLNVVPSFMSIIISFGVSAVIGITFGYFPAKKASALNPIDALKYD